MDAHTINITELCKYVATLKSSFFHFFQTYVYVLDSDTPTPKVDTSKEQYHHTTTLKQESHDRKTAQISLWDPGMGYTISNGDNSSKSE